VEGTRQQQKVTSAAVSLQPTPVFNKSGDRASISGMAMIRAKLYHIDLKAGQDNTSSVSKNAF